MFFIKPPKANSIGAGKLDKVLQFFLSLDKSNTSEWTPMSLGKPVVNRTLAVKNIEGYAKVFAFKFYFIAFLVLMIIPYPICIPKVHTLTIPKW